MSQVSRGGSIIRRDLLKTKRCKTEGRSIRTTNAANRELAKKQLKNQFLTDPDATVQRHDEEPFASSEFCSRDPSVGAGSGSMPDDSSNSSFKTDSSSAESIALVPLAAVGAAPVNEMIVGPSSSGSSLSGTLPTASELLSKEEPGGRDRSRHPSVLQSLVSMSVATKQARAAKEIKESGLPPPRPARAAPQQLVRIAPSSSFEDEYRAESGELSDN